MDKARPKVVIIGAGASGRGHVGQLAFESGYDLVFLDKDLRLTDLLRTAKVYTVRLIGERTRDVTIDRFSAYHLDETEAFYREFCDASLVLTTVCPPNLSDVADYLRPLVLRWLSGAGAEDYKNILCCENMNNGSTAFKGLLTAGLSALVRDRLEAKVGFPDAMIARVVTAHQDPLLLLAEDHSEWTAGPSGPLLSLS